MQATQLPLHDSSDRIPDVNDAVKVRGSLESEELGHGG